MKNIHLVNQENASAVLADAGVRLMQLNGDMTIGIWSSLDSPVLRAALRVFGSDQAPICYLDAPPVPIPDKYKVYRGRSEDGKKHIPWEVIQAMYAHPDEPWKVRDRMLVEIDR